MGNQLEVLVVDKSGSPRRRLIRALEASQRVDKIHVAPSYKKLRDIAADTTLSIVFIDLLRYPINQASQELFALRRRVKEIGVVLYVDPGEVKRSRDSFFYGDRSRLLHYYRLSRSLGFRRLSQELEVVIDLCTEFDLQSVSPARETPSRSVFVSFSFDQKQLALSIIDTLQTNRFATVTGEHTRNRISEEVLERIEESYFFIGLMTRKHQLTDGTYLPSPWVLEEKGAAVSSRKRLVVLVEKGVCDTGGFDIDMTQIDFKQSNIERAASLAVRVFEDHMERRTSDAVRARLATVDTPDDTADQR